MSNDALEDEDEPCTCGAADCKIARAIFDDAMTKLPKKVELFCLSQGDKLMDEQVKEIFQGDYDKVREHIDGWFRDNDHWALDYEVEQILDTDEIEILEAHPSNAMPDHWTLREELDDALRERDESDPLGELIRATPDVMLRLDARVTIDDGDSPEYIVETLCRELRLSPALNRERIMQWLAKYHDEVWGDVEIIWRADIQEAVDQFKPWEDDPPEGTVAVFADPWLDIGGVLLQLQGQAVVPLTRVNSLPSIESEICSDREFADNPQVTTEFDWYRESLVAFFDYRAAILERA